MEFDVQTNCLIKFHVLSFYDGPYSHGKYRVFYLRQMYSRVDDNIGPIAQAVLWSHTVRTLFWQVRKPVHVCRG